MPIGTRRRDTIPLARRASAWSASSGSESASAATTGSKRRSAGGIRGTTPDGTSDASGAAPVGGPRGARDERRGTGLAAEEEQGEAVDLEDPADLRDGPVQELLQLDALDERERELREKTIPYAALGVRSEFLGHDGRL